MDIDSLKIAGFFKRRVVNIYGDQTFGTACIHCTFSATSGQCLILCSNGNYATWGFAQTREPSMTD